MYTSVDVTADYRVGSEPTLKRAVYTYVIWHY